jgi:hypothetical protein
MISFEPRSNSTRIKIRGQYYPDIILAKVFAETNAGIRTSGFAIRPWTFP